MAGHNRKKLDLTGQRFGFLEVLGPADNIGIRTAWRCRCDCGIEKIETTRYLRAGKARSCGKSCPVAHPNPTECRKSDEKPAVAMGLNSLHYADGTCVEMLRSNKVRRNNKSGVPGVEWRPSKSVWRSTICFKGKRYYLGSFKQFDQAVVARKRAEKELVEPFLKTFPE